MKILSINQNNLYFKGCNFKKKKTTPTKEEAPKLKKLGKPLSIAKQINKEEEFYKNFLKKKGKVTLKEYNDIKQNHPRTLVKCYELCRKNNSSSTPTEIAKFALSLKDKYDRDFEEYTIVSIGNSPAPITEVMSALGCNVIFAPISKLRFLDTNTLDSNFSNHRNIDLMAKYCIKKGVEKSKNVILLDYVSTGKTLEKAQYVFSEKTNIKKESLTFLISVSNDN